MAGLWFEEFTDGMVFNHEWSRTITEADNVWFSLLTMKRAAAPYRRALRHEVGMGQRPLVNSLFTLGPVDRHDRQRHHAQHHARQFGNDRCALPENRCSMAIR